MSPYGDSRLQVGSWLECWQGKAPRWLHRSIVDRNSGEIYYGKVPAYSVVVPGSLPNKSNPNGPSLYCAVIVKKVDEKTRSKTSINDLLRD